MIELIGAHRPVAAYGYPRQIIEDLTDDVGIQIIAPGKGSRYSAVSSRRHA